MIHTPKLERETPVPVPHDDGASDGHADGPATEDDRVLVLFRPLQDLLSRGELLPLRLLLSLGVLYHTLRRARPIQHVRHMDAVTW